ncbi:alpha/beta hydrolase [Kitasatospora sp. NPDC088351]|uniref:alpha/beta fold hydrolase n=1 Tax=Kitasatospora sp. NPDC088351 TaxID=3155180 RepID=UPI00343B65E4
MNVHITAADRLGEERLPDGRLLAWAEWGPVDGTPVLHSPGAATTRALGFGADAVDALGVRLISLDRPGLGSSTPAPGRTFADFAADIRAFAERRGLGRPAMLGNSQGAPFALACAAAGAVGALALVSAADEVAAPHFAAPGPADAAAVTSRAAEPPRAEPPRAEPPRAEPLPADPFPAELRRLIDLAVADPQAAEELFAGFTPQAMWDMVMAGSPAPDLAVYRSPAFAAAYRRALDTAFAQGPAGYARDTALAMGRWGIDFSAVTVPVDVWYGELDTTHSPDQGATLSSRLPTATRHTVPGAGGALLWTHAEEILRTLLERI